MNDPRQQHGNHTWDLVVDYHMCPHCGHIVQNQQVYQKKSGVYEIDMICDRCNKLFNATPKYKPTS